MSSRITRELALDALRMALTRRRPLLTGQQWGYIVKFELFEKIILWDFGIQIS
jgi:hypothetical protein